jgi:alanine racemase
MKATPLSCLELSKNNLVFNIKQFKKLAKKGTKFAIVIKGNAYGHGQNQIARISEPYADYFQVDGVEELELLKKVSNKKVFTLGYVEISDLPRIVKLRSILSVFSLKQILALDAAASKARIKQEIHVPVDAYLGREGFLFKELPEVLSSIKKCPNLRLTGMYAHFANIEDTADFTHAKKQIKEYEKAISLARKYGFKNLQTHMSATSGLLAYEKSAGIHPMIRLGIGIYGMWPSEDLKRLYKSKLSLKPVLTWKTKVAEIKILPKGSTIGYGLTYKTKKATKIALVPQGYSDGLDRHLSNKGAVLIHGKRCPILGRVMMNMFSVDVSSLKKVNVEDEVVILGKQGRQEITAEEIAKLLNTINYEVTARISALLPKIVI